MSNTFNPDDYKFNDSSEVQDSTSDSDVEKAVVSRTMKARGKVRTFKDDMKYSSASESAGFSSMSAGGSMSSSAGLASDATRAAQEASAINAMRSSKITVGNREYTPGMGSKGVGGLNGSDGVFPGQNAVQQNSSMARAKAARVFGAMSEMAGKAKDSVERNASKIKSYGDKFSFEDDGQDGAKEALNDSKSKAGDIGGSVSDGVRRTAAAISSARDRARQAKQAQLDKQLAAAQAQAQAQAKLNQDSRFTNKSDKFSDGFSKFSSKDRFDDKNGRFTAETDDRGLYKAKPDKADIEKAVTAKNIDKFNADKASGYDIAKGGKDNDFERKKNKYADRFIDPEQKKLDAQKANQLALNNDAKSAEITKQQKRDALAVNKKKFDKRSKKNRGVAVGSLVSKGKLKAPSKSLLKKQSKMRVIKAIGSGALLIGDDGKLEQGVRQGSGTGVGGKVRNALGRVGDAIKATLKALLRLIGFMIRHPVISIVLILIIFLFVALFTAINGATVNWSAAEEHTRVAVEASAKLKSQKTHLPVMTIRGPLAKQIWGGAKSIDFTDEAAAALIGDAATQSTSVYDKNGNRLRYYKMGDSVDYANGEYTAFAADYDDGIKIGLWGFRYDTGDAQALREYAKAHDKEWTDVAVQLSYYYETDPQTVGGWLHITNSTETAIYALNKNHYPNEATYDWTGHKPERDWALMNAESYYKVYQGETFVGEDIVNFALQYVGNAYAIGGDNLNGHIPGEDGIDCSHFVYRVLQETGHYSGGYVTSKLWANLGTPVTLEELRAGDVVAYDGEPYGHVVIIVENLGGGKCEIVHAKGKNYGIVDEVVNDIYSIHGPGNCLGFRRFTY